LNIIEGATGVAKALTVAKDQALKRENSETDSLTNGDGSMKDRCLETPTRIAIIVSHPIQHFAPLYRALASSPGVVLKVFFCCRWGAEAYYDRDFGTKIKWDIPLLEGYDWEFMKNRKEVKSLTFWDMDNPNVGEVLEEFHPDVVQIHGYAQRTIWRAVRWCHRNLVPTLLFSDSNGTARRALWKRAAKAVVVKLFYRYVDGALSCGDNNRRYHEQYGIPERRIFAGTMPIDSKRLIASVGDAGLARREIRGRLGIPEDAFVVTFAGKLIPLKCPLHLLDAVFRCVQRGLNVWGLIVGEGPERERLEAFIAERKMKNVVLAGFVNQSSIGKYFAASETLAFMSSRDAHPLTVPEAGCFGCPAILSDQVGCIGPTDSARPGENALVYPWSDIDALTNCIVRLYKDRSVYCSMSTAARKIAVTQDIDVAARQLKGAAVQLKTMGCRL
jgi:glycosyltransferase involved in cell wall biosynthesis